MANTYEAALDNNLGSDAEYQAFIQSYEAALLASGFLEVTSDTGQINPTTVVRPSVSTYSGYRMYRAKDSIAAARPFYLKVEYGVGTVNDRMLIRRTLATGSNGSGTLTGVTSSATVLHSPSAVGSGAGAATIYGGGGAHAAFVYTLDAASSSHSSFWIIGRLLDQTDGSVGDPVLWEMFIAAGTTTIGNYLWSDGGSTWTNVSSGLGNLTPDLNISIHSGGDASTTRLFQVLVYRSGKTWVIPILSGKTAELPFTNPTASKFDIVIWGANHTFLPIPQGAVNGGNRIALLWE